MKFIIENKLVVVLGEEDFLITKPTSTLYIETTKEVLKSTFQTFEITNISDIYEGAQIPTLHLPKASVMMAKIMLKERFKPRDGLGKYV